MTRLWLDLAILNCFAEILRFHDTNQPSPGRRDREAIMGSSTTQRFADRAYEDPKSPLAADALDALKAFKASITDFFVEDQEVTTEKKLASVYDVLYGCGPSALMNFMGSSAIDKKPSFRWIHLPANNVSSGVV